MRQTNTYESQIVGGFGKDKFFEPTSELKDVLNHEKLSNGKNPHSNSNDEQKMFYKHYQYVEYG